ncbi:uncharacterized protein [Enoplosus armatus]|uniref:uncharacterized protein isoform X2 n=1 Tax=Enoplosus armatus TaxID=215367 RepID=UPI003993A5F8
MTWRYETPLILLMFLSMIDLSEEGCKDYFKMEKWARNLTETISLVRTKDSKDVMECTVERECLQGREICHWLPQCFDRPKVKRVTKSEKCEGETSQKVHFYHFLCLTAKAFSHTPEGCEYETVCELYSEKPSTRQILNIKDETNTFTLTTLFKVSVILNVLLPLAVYLWMRHQRRREWRPQASANGKDAETLNLMKPPEPLSVVTCSDDVIGNDCAAGDGTLQRRDPTHDAGLN